MRRILRVKLWAGVFDKGAPSTRPLAGEFAEIGSPEARGLARQAVRETLVLKITGNLLPLRPGANILVAGKAADSIAQQSGGWSITWQGNDVPDGGFPQRAVDPRRDRGGGRQGGRHRHLCRRRPLRDEA
ncbi:hypothetical protein AB5I41_13165 [Sphingomonas sp. MMS24-JH45]